jgi:hypothetical protein
LRWFIRAVVERTVRPPEVRRGAGCGGGEGGGKGEDESGGGSALASALAFLSVSERAEVDGACVLLERDHRKEGV